jgi:UTP:GlnB (protein PII) uridylyltransferase
VSLEIRGVARDGHARARYRGRQDHREDLGGAPILVDHGHVDDATSHAQNVRTGGADRERGRRIFQADRARRRRVFCAPRKRRVTVPKQTRNPRDTTPRHLQEMADAARKKQTTSPAVFLASMPEAYRTTWERDLDAVIAHAAIADEDDDRSARIEIWRELPDDVVAVCVVADDRPGLLSRISAAVVTHEMDVVRAEAYCRTRADGTTQAVDLLWLRRFARADGAVRAPIRRGDLATIEKMVDALVRGHAKFELEASFPPPRHAAGAETIVRFERNVLTVEARDRPGLLLAVTKTLFRAGLQITGVKATSEQGLAKDRFEIAELDGKPLALDRQLELQIAILAALEEAP